MSDNVYFKRNVNYVVGGRHFVGDTQGFSLNAITPYVTVKKENLRDFKLANKMAILEGLIIQAEEPTTDWETNNAVSDEDAEKLVKNYMLLKQNLELIDSLSTAAKILEKAKELDRPQKTIKLIESRVAELQGDDENFFDRDEGDDK